MSEHDDYRRLWAVSVKQRVGNLHRSDFIGPFYQKRDAELFVAGERMKNNQAEVIELRSIAYFEASRRLKRAG